MARIRTLIVDDSALVRKIVTDGLANDPEIEIVGTAVDPYVARDKILALDPDVLTLDIEMPRMDGLTFLKLIMKHRPMPVIIMSSLTTAGSGKVLEALQAGAVDVVAKPDGSFSAIGGSELAAKIKAAAQSKYRRPPASLVTAPTPQPIPKPPPPAPAELATRLASQPSALSPSRAKLLPEERQRMYAPRQLILMGASTGGTEALKHVLTKLSGDLPGICIVQHIPAYFSRAFAQRLNQVCELEVREACHNDRVEPGLVLIAPGGQHMVLKWHSSHYTVELNNGPMIHHQRPAVDILFDSAMKAGAGPHSLALLLTGMGADGASGMLHLKEAGTTTIAQNEESCVVYGMPREAVRLGAAQHILHLDHMPARIEKYANEVALKTTAATA